MPSSYGISLVVTVGVATENFEKESIPEYGNFWGISPFTNTRITRGMSDGNLSVTTSGSLSRRGPRSTGTVP